jgi:DNA mismatch repair protein MLH3
MTDETHVIRRLPPPVQARLRSTQILTSLQQIISELVQNALDANASAIDIGLDCAEWNVWVRDNGAGISKDGLESLAEGGRYSSCYILLPGHVWEES